MGSTKHHLNESNFDSYLSSLGFDFPITEIDLQKFNENNSGFEHQLNGNEISPQKIIDEVAQEENETQLVQKSNVKSLYFRRVVLAGEIASQLYMEPTFGHIKFQKIVYLCEKVSQLKTQERYYKQAAGPFDNKFMYSIDKEFKKQKWFDVLKEGSYNKYIYKPLDKIANHSDYFNRYFNKYAEDIYRIIDTFRKASTSQVELVATIYACLEEFSNSKEDFSESKLFEKIYTWSKRKEKYSKTEILQTYSWMQKENLTPDLISNY